MRKVSTPPRNLVLRDLVSEGDATIRFTASNQGEPYRETLTISFERGAYGDFSGYEDLGSAELEPDEECQLREFLNARAERRGGWSR